ncbi:TcfC E-set like domain-containing protein [Sphingomonas kyungheensis]|uniref:TcfC E-set like domain-containing protein n=1 Tax=Sphingomonas kyungheensis TaxID=1069987 RepID=A0ABU8H6C8_9SPHN
MGWSTGWCALALALLGTAPAAARDAATDAPPRLAVAAPAGFDGLLAPQAALVDVYLGGRAIGQARVHYRGDRISFDAVDALVALIPDVRDPAAVRAALAIPELPAHRALVCASDIDPADCRTPTPDVAGVVFDEARFRVDLFLHPRLLAVRPAAERRYLPRPPSQLTLVDQIGGTIAGSGGYRDYALLNRALLGYGPARLRSETSYSSRYGLLADTLAAELDTPGYRLSAGVQWAPGIDLTGRRRLVGVGVQSQIDTRLDRTVIVGSPLIVSLAMRSRVDVLRDGRLLTSRSYDAGNQAIDTSGLPDGAYEVVLRITGAGGAVRDERRFFTKNAAIPTVGAPIVFAYAGVLADDRNGRFVSPSRVAFYEAGIARRLDPHLALDATLIGTDRNAMVELGGYWLGRTAQLRGAALASVTGQFGVLVQASAAEAARFHYAIDLRRVWSRGDRPLVPLGARDDAALGLGTEPAARLASGGFTQINATVNYALPRGQIALSGFYRDDRRTRASYGLGPSLTMPLIQRGGVQVTLRGDATVTNQAHAVYLGISLQRLRGTSAVSATAGLRGDGGAGVRGRAAPVGGIGAAWQTDRALGGTLALSGGVEREIDGTLARGHADWRGDAASLSADLAQPLAGSNGTTQYSLGFQTTAAVMRQGLAMQGRERNDSVILVALAGAAPDGGADDAAFEVLVDNGARGIVRPGGTLAVSVPAYRQYAVRLRPTGAALMQIDGGARTVSVYPGTVARLAWRARTVMAMFGRLLWRDGSPVADAAIRAPGAIGSTDGAGYFQIETARDATLRIAAPDGRSCAMPVRATAGASGYAALGTLICGGGSIFNQIADARP